MVALRRHPLWGVPLIATFFFVCGVALAAESYADRIGDVEGGEGPDIASVVVLHTKTKVTFRVRFAKAPPLRVSTREGWVDMLLVGIDVPPLGPRPIPDGEWLGANFAVGTHGPSKTGRLVRAPAEPGEEWRPVASFGIVARGSVLTFSLPRRALGDPPWFAFTVAAARETSTEGAGGGVDTAPARGTFRYVLAG